MVTACFCVVVTMVLLVAWQWAVAATTVDADPAIAAPADPSATLTTPMLSFRRAPGVLSRAINTTAFRVQLSSVLDRVPEGSCVSVAIDGQVVSAKGSATPVIPASNMKLVVGAVALEVLGPAYAFRTRVLGEIGDGGVVAGDLVLLGGGDPLLTTDVWLAGNSQTFPPTSTTRLEALADAVVAAGVTRVNGRVVGDASRFDDEYYHPSWSTELHGVEGGPIDALMVDDGWLGTTPGAGFATDPAFHAADVFADLLRARGVPVAQGAAVGVSDFGTEIAGIDSQPLATVVQEMLTTSDDNTAEALVKEFAASRGADGTTAAGLDVVRSTLAGWGVPLDGVVLADGSGLSRDNRLTCDALIAVLARGTVDDPLGAGLPVAATSGTLTDQFTGSPVAGVLRAKTGSLNGVRALSGYYPAVGGDTVEFALVLNTPGADDVSVYGSVWDALAVSLPTYPSGATTDQLAPR
ncbi:MAG: D-alanyl-D-alanine carboxypeptidase/D-alanyl-D-alanine-endopeptidase [Actinomycetes bacterium]|uniref:Unannotated protein n=1 Tax=freshwater metagenome TaxID=449393 RepID=A0A6J6CI06_9ZZZZ